MSELGDEIKKLALQLTSVRSVGGTVGEISIAQTIYDYLAQDEYFRAHPENLKLVPLVRNPQGRSYVMAIVEGVQADSPADTVLCLGHFDTVGVEDYAELKPYATNPEELRRRLLETIQFNPVTTAEIQSDRWLLGRGILDMKTGVAAHMVMVREYARRVAELHGNLVFIGVPDEEGDSAGMLSAVQDLYKLAAAKGWRYIAAVDTDYMTTQYPDDENKYIYVGTVGKLLPCFYLYGEETHVGEPFNGLDANLLSSEVLYQMDLCTDLCDVADGEVTLPPISLHQTDLKTEYSVQTANAVTLYFNFATHSLQPDEVLERCRQKAYESFENVIRRLNEEYEKYCRLTGIPFKRLPWMPNVLTYDELYQRVRAEMGDEIDRIIDDKARELLEKEIDDREFSLAIVHEVHKYYSDQNSKIVVYLAPPYYPHIFVKGDEEREQRLLKAIEYAVSAANSQYDYQIATKKFYPYISDLSFCSLPRDEAAIHKLTDNMPAWGRKYTLPVHAIQNISMPVVNIGPYGKDAHKLSERLCMDYSYDAMPLVLEKTLEYLLMKK